MFNLRSAVLPLVAAAIVFAAAAPPAGAESATAQRLPTSWVVKHLARKGGEELLEIGHKGDAFRAVVRYPDGRVALLVIDSETGDIRPADQGDLLMNSVDLGVLDSLRGAVAEVAPAAAKPAHAIVDTLMATGKYRDLRSLRLSSGAYRVVMEDHAGGQVALIIDAETGRLAGDGA